MKNIKQTGQARVCSKVFVFVSMQLHQKFEALKKQHGDEKNKFENRRRQLDEEMNLFQKRKAAAAQAATMGKKKK